MIRFTVAVALAGAILLGGLGCEPKTMNGETGTSMQGQEPGSAPKQEPGSVPAQEPGS